MEKSEKLNFSQLKYQYLAVICGEIRIIPSIKLLTIRLLTPQNPFSLVNLLSFSQGYCIGWVTPTLKILRSESSPLHSGPITLLETTLMGFLPCLGAFLGTIIFSIISNHLGRIASITLLAIPNMVRHLPPVEQGNANMTKFLFPGILDHFNCIELDKRNFSWSSHCWYSVRRYTFVCSVICCGNCRSEVCDLNKFNSAVLICLRKIRDTFRLIELSFHQLLLPEFEDSLALF